MCVCAAFVGVSYEYCSQFARVGWALGAALGLAGSAAADVTD